MKKVCCDECGKFLINTSFDTASRIGIEIQQKGFVYKNACLFSEKYNSLYFCNADCAKKFYAVNIPKTEKNIAIQEALQEVRKEIPKMAKECSEGLAEFMKLIKSRSK